LTLKNIGLPCDYLDRCERRSGWNSGFLSMHDDSACR